MYTFDEHYMLFMSRKIFSLKIVKKQKETPNAYVFTFSIFNELKSEFQYIAGQYITVHLKDKNGIQHSRHYSICDYSDSQNISFCVKRVPNGLVSNILCDDYNLGDRLQLSTPIGDFILDNSVLENYGNLVFVTGGSGITPIKSMIDYALENNFDGNIFLIYGSRNVNNIIFHQHLLNIKNDKYKLILSVDESSEGWTGEIGQLTFAKIEELFQEYKIPYGDTCFFTSGPKIIIDNLSKYLESHKVDKTNIKFETFFIQTNLENISADSRLAKIKFKRNTETIAIPPYQNILDATLCAGFKIEHSCKVGDCLTCIAVLKSGKVYSAIKLKGKTNKILTCQSYPLNDSVLVDFNKSIIHSLSTNRNALMMLGLLFSFILFSFLLHPDNESYLAKGNLNTGHENLKCIDCHKPAPGTMRQQLQNNIKHFLNINDDYVQFGSMEVGNVECQSCHDRPNDVHPTHRFMEPRFVSARNEIHPENCTSCHSEHSGKRVTIGQVGFCINCHQDIKINNDPLDVSHEYLISTNQWKTCLQCHDFHGNHVFKPATNMKDTIPVKKIENYFKGGEDPYGEVKKYIVDKLGKK